MQTIYDKKIQRTPLLPGLGLTYISDSRFKSNLIKINFLTPATDKNASENSFITRVLSRKTAKYPNPRDLQKAVEKLYGAGINGSASLIGDAHVASFSVSVIDDKYALENEELTLNAATLLAECLENPLWAELDADIKSQCDDIAAAVNDKRQYARIKANQIIFGAEPARVFPEGTIKLVEDISPKNIALAYEELFRTANIEIICAGRTDFNTLSATFTDLFTRLFGKYSRQFISAPITSPSALKSAPETVSEPMDITQSKLVLGLKTNTPINSNVYALQLANKIYGGGVSSKLFLNVREKQSLCYYCSSAFDRLKGVMTVQSGVDNENLEKAETALIAELDSVKKGNFTDEDVTAALVSIKNDFKQAADSKNVLATRGFSQVYRNDFTSINEEIAVYEDVKKDDIIAAANSFVLDSVYKLVPQN
jgi:predicted Zn-dependent peptidase